MVIERGSKSSFFPFDRWQQTIRFGRSKRFQISEITIKEELPSIFGADSIVTSFPRPMTTEASVYRFLMGHCGEPEPEIKPSPVLSVDSAVFVQTIPERAVEDLQRSLREEEEGSPSTDKVLCANGYCSPLARTMPRISECLGHCTFLRGAL